MSMSFPEIGALNRRITFKAVKTVKNESSGFSNTVTSEFTVWGRVEAVGAQIFWNSSQIDCGITHRIFVRADKGRTYPQDFKNVRTATCDGVVYKIVRVTDVAGAKRFTVLDVRADTVL